MLYTCVCWAKNMVWRRIVYSVVLWWCCSREKKKKNV